MGTVKAKDIQQSEILRLEAEINNLWGELNTVNVSHAFRVEMEDKLAKCEVEFKSVLNGQNSMQTLEKKLNEMDMEMAQATIDQALHEIPKGERGEKTHLALQAIRQQLKENEVSPIRARHEVKEIMRMRVV